MDYEKKYKEALEKAIIAYKDEDKHIKATLERIFSELRESEDERIRKEIIEDYHSAKRLCREGEEGTKKILDEKIAWLEKQSNLMNALQEANKRIGELIEENFILKKQEPNNSTLEEKARIDDAFTRMMFKDKPDTVWGDKDNQYLLICKNALWKYQASDKWDASIISQWLENKLRSSGYWSKEDEENRLLVNKAIWDYISEDGITQGEAASLIRWLKSFNPQFRWKPSPEQLEALHHYVETTSDGEIELLYNDLKKLL